MFAWRLVIAVIRFAQVVMEYGGRGGNAGFERDGVWRHAQPT